MMCDLRIGDFLCIVDRRYLLTRYISYYNGLFYELRFWDKVLQLGNKAAHYLHQILSTKTRKCYRKLEDLQHTNLAQRVFHVSLNLAGIRVFVPNSILFHSTEIIFNRLHFHFTVMMSSLLTSNF
jgi:hypothetical protein